MSVGFTKIKELDAWGLRSSEKLEVGSQIKVTKRNGETSEVKVGALIKHYPAGQYPEAYIYVIENGNGNGNDNVVLVLNEEQAKALFAVLNVTNADPVLVPIRDRLSNAAS